VQTGWKRRNAESNVGEGKALTEGQRLQLLKTFSLTLPHSYLLDTYNKLGHKHDARLQGSRRETSS
jgi:hypothetical protein